jgi:PKD repeat protein
MPPVTGSYTWHIRLLRKTVDGVWQEPQIIFDEGYDHIDLKLDSENNPHVSFYNISQGMGILYQRWSGDLAGPVEKIESQWHGGQMEGMITSIITDNMNQPHISYVGSINNDYRENIKHAWKKDGVWHIEKVDDGSYASSGNKVVLDISGALNFGYNDHIDNQLRYATNIAGPWIRQIVDEEIQWGDLEFAMDNDRYGHMALPGVKYALIPPVEYFNVDPDSLDFGAVKPDSTRIMILKLSNPSGKDIRIDNVEVDDDRFSFSKTSFILGRLAEDTISVTFKQDAEAMKVDNRIRMIYNSPSGLMMEIPVKVRPWQPALATDPEYISFGAVPKYTLETRSITLENIGATDLILSNIDVKYELWPGYYIPTDFLLAGHNCSTLHPGDTCEVEVSFQPNKDGTQVSYLNISSNDPETPVRKISITGTTPVPQIFTDKTNIEFGYCPIGQKITDSLILINWGSDILNITSVGLSGTDADQFSYTSSCASIPAGDSCTVKVMLTPTRSGDLQATLAITSNSQYSKILNILLTGSSYLRTLELSSDLINFGRVNVGEQTSALLELRNTGSVDLTVSGLQLTGSDIYEFSHNYDCYIISAGTVCTDTVFFAPIYEGSKTASLTISSNDSYEPEKIVVLTGQVGAVLPLQLTISMDPETGIAPLTVKFTSSVSGGQPPYQYLWNFRDGSTSTDAKPVHQFTSIGSYTVTCTVKDINLQTVEDSVEVAVSSEDVPAVVASADPESGYAPLTVYFKAEVSGGNAPLTFSWDFDDGSFSQQQYPVHGFSFTGSYNVKVVVTDADVDNALDSVLINVLKEASITGDVMNEERSVYIEKSTVILYPETWPSGNDTLHLVQDHTFHFSDIDTGNYTICVIPDPVDYPDYLPTYFGNILYLAEADWLDVDGPASGLEINVLRKPDNPGGTGMVAGTLVVGEPGKKIAVSFNPVLKAGNGIKDCNVFLLDYVLGDLEAWDITGSEGRFEFDSLLTGTYIFKADWMGLPMDPENEPLELNSGNDTIEILAIAGAEKIMVELVETGLDDQLYRSGIKIYPVPVSNKLVISIANGILTEGMCRVSIYNLTGKQLIAEYTFVRGQKTLELDILKLPDGFYLLRIEDKNNSYEFRFIKAY